MCAFSYAWSLLVTSQRWQFTIGSAILDNSSLYANLMALCFIEPELWLIEGLHCRNRDFFCFYDLDLDLDLDLMTFINELDQYFQMCLYELPTLRLSKVII